jgi:hypothetical protein
LRVGLERGWALSVGGTVRMTGSGLSREGGGGRGLCYDGLPAPTLQPQQPHALSLCLLRECVWSCAWCVRRPASCPPQGACGVWCLMAWRRLSG